MRCMLSPQGSPLLMCYITFALPVTDYTEESVWEVQLFKVLLNYNLTLYDQVCVRTWQKTSSHMKQVAPDGLHMNG